MAGGGVQEEGQLAKGIGGELSDIMGVGAEQRWSPGGNWGGSQYGRMKRLGGAWFRGQQGLPVMARMLGPTSLLGWSEDAPDPPPIDPPSSPLLILQGVIYAAKELDYEISHGRYTLIVTATDQCPILSHRLTSTTTVGGWVDGTEPQLGGGVGQVTERSCGEAGFPGETPKSTSPVLVSATHPNLQCDFEEVTEPLCVAAAIR